MSAKSSRQDSSQRSEGRGAEGRGAEGSGAEGSGAEGSGAEGSGADRRPRGRPPTIDRDAVLDTALGLLDAEGVEALTMRRLASELGVSAMTPYRYVGSKDELLMVLVDRLAARLVYPPRPRDPKAAMLVLWSTIYDSLAEHTWVPEVLARRRMMAPSVLDAIEEIHAALRDAGLSINAAVRAYRLMWNFTLGALLVRAGASAESRSQQRELRGAPDPDRYPMLAAAATAWAAAHDRDTYHDDLAALIDGLLPHAARE
jgi:AcrR family transcriptional regulator